MTDKTRETRSLLMNGTCLTMGMLIGQATMYFFPFNERVDPAVLMTGALGAFAIYVVLTCIYVFQTEIHHD